MFCQNSEGWGPISSLRYDFTPCFVEGLHLGFALGAVLIGSLTIWWLLRTQSQQPTRKDWHYFSKLVLVALITTATTIETYVVIQQHPGNWIGDVRYWALAAEIPALGIMFTLHNLEHERLRAPSSTLLIYWLLYILLSIIRTRSLYIRNFAQHQTVFALGATSLVTSLMVFILELFVAKAQSVYRKVGSARECPQEYSNIFSDLTYSWFTPLVSLGYKKYLTEEDLWDLPSRNTSTENADKFAENWRLQGLRKRPRVWKTLFATYGGTYIRYVPLKLGGDVVAFLQPQLLRLLIGFVESYSTPNPQPPLRGFLIAMSMLCVSLTQSICNNQFMGFAFELGQNVRSGLIVNIYRKSLRLSTGGVASKSTGDIVNLMAVDTQRIADLSRQGHQLWTAPWQMMLCLVSLYNLLGWSGLTGLGLLLIMIPLNSFIVRLMKRFQRRQMKNKDERTRMVTEILNNMKSIKLYSWTQAFREKLSEVRNEKELRTLRKIGGTQALSRFIWNSTPFFVSCSTFTVYVLTSNVPLTVDLVFPALTLFNFLAQPLQQLPNVISSLVESTVALGRLEDFLLAEEVQADAVKRLPAATKKGENSVIIEDCSFAWDVEATPTLSDIDMTARHGELTCIVGKVGSGKTSMVSGILGQMHKLAGHVTLKGSVAYVSQNAWIMNASVKDNILFGHRYDPDFYNKTIFACCLVEDISILPDGDRTEVGEKGISLSGGQKARLQLARAIYARADVYLFDDILSAVDQHVGRHIINHVVGPRGLLRGKTRILATNSIPVLIDANEILMLEEGRIVERGSFVESMQKNGKIAALIRFAKNADEDEQKLVDVSASSTPTVVHFGGDEDSDSNSDTIGEKDDIFEKASRDSIDDLRRASICSLKGREKPDEEVALIKMPRKTKETSAKGKVKWNIYMAYAQACGIKFVYLWITALIGVQILQVSSAVWLKSWAESNQGAGENVGIGKNIGIYFGLGISSSAMLVVSTMIMWLLLSITASRVLHEQMANAMFRSPMSFFECTPLGRILNRFSSDTFRVDEAIGRSFSDFFGCVLKTFFTLGVICSSAPVFIAILIPLAVIYLFVQRYYIRSNRELKRLESVSRSPIYSHFAESLSGLATIRAFQQEQRWAYESENRVDANMRAWFPSIWANRWLGIRLEAIGGLVVFLSATLSVVSVTNGGGPSAGMVGLAMSYALQITQYLNWMVRLSVEVETNIVSVERVLEYAKLPSEAEEVIRNNRPLPTWPAHGAVKFHDFSMRYRPELDLVLKGVNLDLKSREKIGIVGRTGAGKSSLTLSLFRIIEAAAGCIEIDNLDTSSIGLSDLRSRLAIIPQDAALFQGTIRDNLDPSHSRSDEDLWHALEHARLKTHVQTMPGGLDAAVQEAGSNLSQGQKQLVSLARALLTDSTILVLDEATAAVDVQTDALLQETLRGDLFSDRTIITIAHRINTIIDYDKIVVLQRGEVVEFGTPEQLIKSRGQFFELAREGGLVS